MGNTHCLQSDSMDTHTQTEYFAGMYSWINDILNIRFD